MKRAQSFPIIILGIIVFLISALISGCGSGGGDTYNYYDSSPTPSESPTVSPTTTPEPTSSPTISPSPSLSPSPTISPSPSPSPTETPDPEIWYVTISADGSTSITADDTLRFSAYAYYYNGAMYNVTDLASWQVSDSTKGFFLYGSVFNPMKTGSVDVYCIYRGHTSTAITVDISHGAPVNIEVLPENPTISSATQFSADAFDHHGNGWGVESLSTWTTTDPYGFMVGNTYYPGSSGYYTITANYEGVSGNTTATVTLPSSVDKTQLIITGIPAAFTGWVRIYKKWESGTFANIRVEDGVITGDTDIANQAAYAYCLVNDGGGEALWYPEQPNLPNELEYIYLEYDQPYQLIDFTN